MMGINRLVVLAHEWEPYYKDEFRRSARLARELSVSIEPYFEDDDQRCGTGNTPEEFDNKDLYTTNPIEADDFTVWHEAWSSASRISHPLYCGAWCWKAWRSLVYDHRDRQSVTMGVNYWNELTSLSATTSLGMTFLATRTIPWHQPRAEVLDTLVLSRLFASYPWSWLRAWRVYSVLYGRHSLKAWGYSWSATRWLLRSRWWMGHLHTRNVGLLCQDTLIP